MSFTLPASLLSQISPDTLQHPLHSAVTLSPHSLLSNVRLKYWNSFSFTTWTSCILTLPLFPVWCLTHITVFPLSVWFSLWNKKKNIYSIYILTVPKVCKWRGWRNKMWASCHQHYNMYTQVTNYTEKWAAFQKSVTILAKTTLWKYCPNLEDWNNPLWVCWCYTSNKQQKQSI